MSTPLERHYLNTTGLWLPDQSTGYYSEIDSSIHLNYILVSDIIDYINRGPEYVGYISVTDRTQLFSIPFDKIQTSCKIIIHSISHDISKMLLEKNLDILSYFKEKGIQKLYFIDREKHNNLNEYLINE